MGQNSSTPVGQCLQAVCADRADCLATPDTPFYTLEWAKQYNLDLPVTPAAVIRPNNADDVSAIVKCAAKYDVHVQARSGGHSFANYGLGGSDGEICIDLVNMKDFSMDEDTWHASIGPGYTLGDVDVQLHNNGGRAMSHGTCPGVGIGGHATIGGIGPSSRMWGLALDHVLEVEVVTADGKIQRANENENSDLFWALRGSGHSFGIITEFVVRTQPEPGKVLQYSYGFDLEDPGDVGPLYKQWQEIIVNPDLDRRWNSLFIVHPAGALITGTFYGTEEEYEASGILDSLPSGGIVSFNATDWMGNLAHEAEVAGLYLSNLATPFTGKSLALTREDKLSDDKIDELFQYVKDTDKGTLIWFIIFDPEGGAISDVPADATSYPHRDKFVMYQSYSVGLTGVNDEMRTFVDGVQDIVLGAVSNPMTYAGYIDATITDRTEAINYYWGDHVPKLQQIKAKYDPNQVFLNPQSIPPASS